MKNSLLDRDTLIYREMMTHTPLFAHRHPQHIMLWDEHDRGLTQEILKHSTVTALWQNQPCEDPRIKHFTNTMNEILKETDKNTLDILIIGSTSAIDFNQCLHALHTDGILIQLCESSFDLAVLKNTQQQLKSAGFADILPLHFPQPHFTSGWRAAIMATKDGTIKRPREKDIFNKPFTTNYYNLDMHKAAFALPEFMREELI